MIANMGRVIRIPDWTKASSYAPAGRKRRKSARWFGVLLVALPLGAFSAVFFAPQVGGGAEAVAAADTKAAKSHSQTRAQANANDRERAHFPICSGGVRVTCVVDGDTIWYRGEKIRLVGFDTPEISKPGCANERRLGEKAKLRLQQLLNAGAFSLEPNPEGRAEDRYGRKLLVVSRGGENVGDVLLGEGLAEKRGGWGNVWC